MINLKIKISDNSRLDDLRRKLRQNKSELSFLMARILKAELEYQTAQFPSYSGSGSKKQPHKLSKSWRVEKTARTASVYSEALHARVQDEGATVIPKMAKKLMIPKSGLARNMIEARHPSILYKDRAIFRKHKFALEFFAARRRTTRLKPKNYIQKAIMRAEREMIKDLEREIKIYDRLTGGD